MQLSIQERRIFHGSPEDLWSLLVDPEVLRRCIPGCQSLERAGPWEYRVVLRLGHGPIQGKLHGAVAVKDLDRPESCRLELHARGLAGHVHASTQVSIRRLDGQAQPGSSGTAPLPPRTTQVGPGAPEPPLPGRPAGEEPASPLPLPGQPVPVVPRTEVAVRGDARVGGLLRAAGARLLEDAARSFADGFFAELCRHFPREDPEA